MKRNMKNVIVADQKLKFGTLQIVCHFSPLRTVLKVKFLKHYESTFYSSFKKPSSLSYFKFEKLIVELAIPDLTFYHFLTRNMFLLF